MRRYSKLRLPVSGRRLVANVVQQRPREMFHAVQRTTALQCYYIINSSAGIKDEHCRSLARSHWCWSTLS